MNNYYKVLVFFSQGDKVCRSFLKKHADDQTIEKLIKLGYIVEVGKNDEYEPRYAITQLGREARDS